MTDTHYNMLIKKGQPNGPNIPDFDDIIKTAKSFLDVQIAALKTITDQRRQISLKLNLVQLQIEEINLLEKNESLLLKQLKVEEYLEYFEESYQQAIAYKAEYYNNTDNDPLKEIYQETVRQIAKERNIPESVIHIDTDTGEVIIIKKLDLDQ